MPPISTKALATSRISIILSFLGFCSVNKTPQCFDRCFAWASRNSSPLAVIRRRFSPVTGSIPAASSKPAASNCSSVFTNSGSVILVRKARFLVAKRRRSCLFISSVLPSTLFKLSLPLCGEATLLGSGDRIDPNSFEQAHGLHFFHDAVLARIAIRKRMQYHLG